MPVKLMYSEYMIAKDNNNVRETSWLQKDTEGKYCPVDDNWQQLFHYTENSENLQNIDEEFFQSKPSNIPK